MPKQDSPCMFCGGLPCVCDGGPTKKRSRASAKKASFPAPKPTKKSSPTSSSAESGKGTEDVFGSIPEQARPKFKSKSHSERDLSYESALRILRPIVSEADQKKIDKELKRIYPQAVDRRVAEWRRKHG